MGCCNNNSKKSNAEVIEGMLCYCFCFSEDDLQNAINQKQENDFIKEINNQIRSLGCNCEKLNPSGKCCIPTIKKLIESKKNGGF